jgi:hypothetical protein
MDLDRLSPTDVVFIAQHYGSVFAEATAAKDATDVPNKPGKTNWVQKLGGLPKAIADMAGDLITERGMSVSHAIATAVNRAKELCAKGNGKYCAAVSQWEKMKARA